MKDRNRLSSQSEIARAKPACLTGAKPRKQLESGTVRPGNPQEAEASQQVVSVPLSLLGLCLSLVGWVDLSSPIWWVDGACPSMAGQCLSLFGWLDHASLIGWLGDACPSLIGCLARVPLCLPG